MYDQLPPRGKALRVIAGSEAELTEVTSFLTAKSVSYLPFIFNVISACRGYKITHCAVASSDPKNWPTSGTTSGRYEIPSRSMIDSF